MLLAFEPVRPVFVRPVFVRPPVLRPVLEELADFFAPVERVEELPFARPAVFVPLDFDELDAFEVDDFARLDALVPLDLARPVVFELELVDLEVPVDLRALALDFAPLDFAPLDFARVLDFEPVLFDEVDLLAGLVDDFAVVLDFARLLDDLALVAFDFGLLAAFAPVLFDAALFAPELLAVLFDAVLFAPELFAPLLLAVLFDAVLFAPVLLAPLLFALDLAVVAFEPLLVDLPAVALAPPAFAADLDELLDFLAVGFGFELLVLEPLALEPLALELLVLELLVLEPLALEPLAFGLLAPAAGFFSGAFAAGFFEPVVRDVVFLLEVLALRPFGMPTEGRSTGVPSFVTVLGAVVAIGEPSDVLPLTGS